MTNLSQNSETKVDPMLIQEMLESFNLDWYVKKEPLSVMTTTEDGYNIPESTPFFATVRQDNRHHFAAVKAGYEVFQNHELAELVHRVAGSMGHKVSKGGSFNDGGQVYFQIALEDKRVGNDRIQRWASGINSFDGSTALRWSPETNTISCSNTFWAAYTQMKNSVKHTTNMRGMVERSLKAIEGLQKADSELFEVFTRLTQFEMKPEHLTDLTKIVTGIDLTEGNNTIQDKHSTRSINKATDLLASIESETNDKGRSLWGLFSGLTHYTTHKAGTDKNRDKSKAMGSLARVDNDVFKMMKELVYA